MICYVTTQYLTTTDSSDARNEVKYSDYALEHFQGTHIEHWMIISTGYF